MGKIQFEAGNYTEDMLQFVLANLDDETLDKVEVERIQIGSDGLVTEQVTAQARLRVPPGLEASIVRGAGNFLETQSGTGRFKITIDTFQLSEQGRRAIADLALKHPGIKINLN